MEDELGNWVNGCAQELAFDTAFAGFVPAQQIHGKSPGRGQILGRRVLQIRWITAKAVGSDELIDIGHDSKYLLGLLNSKLLSKHLRAVCPPKLSGYVKFTAKALSATPIRIIDFSKPADKALHDKLMVLVDKILGLMPKLRTATSESEKTTLQNAATATDQQIDQLVYELYNLTPEEIALVEGA